MATLVQRKLDITVRKRSMVPPIEPTPERVLWNSNVDLVIPRIHTQSVYFYPNDGSDDFFSHEKLVEALGKTLVPFYPMAGRLKRGVDDRIEINCNGEGVLLVEAEADAEVADFGEFAPDPRFQQLVPQVDYTQDVSSYPLLCLQITFFKCGGASLGVGMQHHVADGMSGIHCINTWSEMARGIPLKVQPFIDRTLLKARSPPTPKFPHIEYQKPPRLIDVEKVNGGVNSNSKANSANGNGSVNGASHANDNGSVNGASHANGNGSVNGASHANGNGSVNGASHANGNGASNGASQANGNGSVNGASYASGNGARNGDSHANDNGSTSGDSHTNGNGLVNEASHAPGNGATSGSHHINGNGNDHGNYNGHGSAAPMNGHSHQNGNGHGAANGKNGHANHSVQESGNGDSKANVNGHVAMECGSKESQNEDLPMAVRVFKFTKEQLATLKRMAIEEKTTITYSSYEMLSGHIWKCVTQARKLHGSQETKLFIATDGRSRLNPPLPKGYFGNVIFTSTPIASAEELVQNPVTFAASKIHDAVGKMDDEYLRSALDYLELQEDISKLARGAHHFNSPNLGLTSWARMPVYECDFGWGRPIFMGPAAIAYEGLGYVLGSPIGDGTLSLSLGLRSDHMETFEKLVTAI